VAHVITAWKSNDSGLYLFTSYLNNNHIKKEYTAERSNIAHILVGKIDMAFKPSLLRDIIDHHSK